MTSLQANHTLVCEGLACPLPVVRTKKAIDEMQPGHVLEVRATDKGSVADLKSWAGRTGHEYIGLIETDGVFRHYIRKAEAAEMREERKFPHTVSNEEAQGRGANVLVLDVREPAEYAFGHIPGAISIPLGQLEALCGKLDPEHHYYVVCRAGNRSDMACQLLAEKGFKHVSNVLPGMSQWNGPMEQN